MRVGFFVTCLVDTMRPSVGFSAIKLLERAGCEVVVPPTQTCCGQPAWNSGADAHCRDLARKVIDSFLEFDYVVVPSGSCAGMIRNHYPEALKDDGVYHLRALSLAKKTYELTQFLVEVARATDFSAKYNASACYHDSCSCLREMFVHDAPRQLLANVEGLELKPLKDADVCCGFGGLFSVKYPEISERMADDKLSDAKNSEASLVIGPDLGCLLHLAGRAARRGENLRFRHIAEVLANCSQASIGEGT
ncbi:MAG: (Fe-S)-binding protein [Rhizomicrobium sp.]